MPRKELPIVPSTLELIDHALFDYINGLDLRATTNKGWKKTPVIWTSAERSYQIKNDKDIRDGVGSLILPIITVERTAVIKDMKKKGVFWGNIEISYMISLRTEYQQQMNELVTPFVTKTGAINYFVMRQEGHFYEGFIQGNFMGANNLAGLGEEERKYETKIDIRVLGYLLGEDNNQETPKMVITENAVEIKIPRERIIVGDIDEHLTEQKRKKAAQRLENSPSDLN